MEIKTRKCKNGFLARLLGAKSGYGVIDASRAPTRDAAVASCLELAKSVGAISQEAREHYLIHGRFEEIDGEK